MRTLQDVRNYAEEKGFSGYRIESLIDEIETDGKGNGNLTDEDYQNICFGIDCEAEEN